MQVMDSCVTRRRRSERVPASAIPSPSRTARPSDSTISGCLRTPIALLLPKRGSWPSTLSSARPSWPKARSPASGRLFFQTVRSLASVPSGLTRTRSSLIETSYEPKTPHPEEPRRARRLEGWATARLVPTLQDAALQAAPQGEAVGDSIQRSSALEPGRLVDLVAQRLPGTEGATVVRHDFEAPLVEVWPVSRHVRCQQHVRQCPKRVLAGQRLLLIDVEGSAGNLAGLQRCDQVIQPGRHAAADVDEERRPLHALEAGAVEETFGRRRMRHRQDDEIRARQQVIQGS